MNPWDVNSAISGTLHLELPLTILKAFQAIGITSSTLLIIHCSLSLTGLRAHDDVFRMLLNALECRCCIIVCDGKLQPSVSDVIWG
jgi:hypothetical protein